MTKIYWDTKIQILFNKEKEELVLYYMDEESNSWVIEDRISGTELAAWWKKKLWEEQSQKEEQPQ